MPSSRYGDRTPAGIAQFGVQDIDARRGVFTADRANLLRHAPERQAEIRIVDQEIENAAAAARFVSEPGAPRGSSTAPSKSCRIKRSGVAQPLPRPAIRGDKTQHLSDHEHASAPLRRAADSIGRFKSEGHRLFKEYVPARVQR